MFAEGDDAQTLPRLSRVAKRADRAIHGAEIEFLVLGLNLFLPVHLVSSRSLRWNPTVFEQRSSGRVERLTLKRLWLERAAACRDMDRSKHEDNDCDLAQREFHAC